MPPANILIADDDGAIRTVLNQALSRAGYDVRLTGNAATLWRWVSQGEGDIVTTIEPTVQTTLQDELDLIKERSTRSEDRLLANLHAAAEQVRRAGSIINHLRIFGHGSS